MKRDTISLSLDLGNELICDEFCGGGGASEGMEAAFGRPVDIAVNHNAEAIAMHQANHPDTKHHCKDVFEVDPIFATGNLPVGLIWLSPDCRDHSKAKGGKPVDKKIRGLAWSALKWGGKTRARVVMLENVEELQDWTGLIAKRDKATGRVVKLDGTVAAVGERVPVREQHLVRNPKTKGSHFRRLVRSFESMGYTVDYRELRACDYDVPTIRKRLYVIARRDHLPIVWPAPTNGAPNSVGVKSGKLKPWRTAAECIDWTIPCPSIFTRQRPLKDATLRRIAKGIMKFVVNSANPFIVKFSENSTGQTADEPLHTVMAGAPRFGVIAPTLMHVTHHGSDRNSDISSPLATVTGAHRGEQALIAATLIQTGYGERKSQAPRVPGIDKPLGTVVAGGAKHAVVAAFLAKHYGGHETAGSSLNDPMSTVTTQDHHHCVSVHIQRDFGQSIGAAADEPMGTVTAGGGGHQALVTSNLIKLRGTNTGQPTDEPLHTISAQGLHHAEVRALLAKFCGESVGAEGPNHGGLGIVTINGEQYAIVDIGMRMLTPRELARAQGFPDTYVLDPIFTKKKPVGASRKNPTMVRTHAGPGQFKYVSAPLSKSAQVRMIGNSVCPGVAKALILANFAHEKQMAGAAA